MRFSRWLAAGSLFATGFAFAGQGGPDTTPQVDFKKPAESVELFQLETRPEGKPEPAVLPDSTKPAQTVGVFGGAVLARSAIESLERIEKAGQLLELADLLASTGDLDRARKGYEEVQRLCPGSRYDGLATRKLEAMTVQQLVGAGEAEAGLSVTDQICWSCLAQVEPAIRLKWLDQAFVAYSKAVDERKTKEMVIYRAVIDQLSPETRESLDRLKPREVNATVRWKFVTVTYTKNVDGKQSLGFGLGVGK
jgi:hypothetical protein